MTENKSQKLPTVTSVRVAQEAANSASKLWQNQGGQNSSRRGSNHRNAPGIGIASPHSSTVGKLHGAQGASPVQRLFDQNKETVEEMLIRKFKAKYVDNNPAFQKDLEAMQQTSPRGVFSGTGRYASLRAKNVFNASGTRWNQTGGQAQRSNYFIQKNIPGQEYGLEQRHASVERQAASLTNLPKLDNREAENNDIQPFTQKNKQTQSIVVQDRNAQNVSPLDARNNHASQMVNFIVNEVQRFLVSKRVTDMTIRELDQKIQMEVYLREKKAAILEDRRIENGPQYTSLGNQEADQKSNLEKVQEKYANVAQEMENRSRRSIANSIAAASQIGSRASNNLNKERLKDFDGVNGADKFFKTQQSERMSCISGLDSEIDEWAALNKLQTLRLHQEAEQKKVVEQQRKAILREELQKQQAEFASRKEVVKQDRLDYARACEERTRREEALEKAKAEAKAKKIEEIKKWRQQNTVAKKAKEEHEKKVTLEAGQKLIEQDVKLLEDAQLKQALNKKKTQDYWFSQYEKTHGVKKLAFVEREHEKRVEAKEAFQRSQIPFYEDIKREADQVKRREENEAREGMFANSVVEKEVAKLRLRDELLDKYEVKREQLLDAEEMRRTNQAEQYKQGILSGLHEQAIAKKKAAVQEKLRQDHLDKAQITAAVERDDLLKAAEREKAEERKRMGTMWMLKAEEQYQKKINDAQNGANRGQKMSKEEIKYNREILKTVSQHKKGGLLNNVFEKCASKKVTTLE